MNRAAAISWFALAVASMVLTSSCETMPPAQTDSGSGVGKEMLVPTAPPPPVVEEVTVSPGPGYVWVAGSWNWLGHWVWESGHWGKPPKPGMVWVPHQFEYRAGKRVFIRGGWK